MATKKKKYKLNVKNLFKLLAVIIIVPLVFMYVFNLRIRNILIEGTTTIRDKEIIELANIKDYPKIYHLNLKKMKSEIKKNPLVDKVSIKRNLLGKLTININEKSPIVFYQNTKKTILSDGTALDANKYLGLPTIINYVPEDKLNLLITGLNKIDPEIVKLINEIEYSPSKNSEGKIIDNSRFILSMNDQNTIYMNTVNIKKLSNYLVIYDEIYNIYGENKGVLKLDSSTDAYVFKTYKAIEKEESEKEPVKEEHKEN